MTLTRTFSVLLLAVSVIFLAGCVMCELRVTNHTDGSIWFYSGHTKKAVEIPAGATRIIPHAAGRVIVISHKDEVWEYDALFVPGLTNEVVRGYQRLTLPLTVEASGVVMLPSGRKVEPTRMIPERL